MIACRIGHKLDRALDARNGFLGMTLSIQHDTQNVVSVGKAGTMLDNLSANALGLREIAVRIELARHFDCARRGHVDAA